MPFIRESVAGMAQPQENATAIQGGPMTAGILSLLNDPRVRQQLNLQEQPQPIVDPSKLVAQLGITRQEQPQPIVAHFGLNRQEQPQPQPDPSKLVAQLGFTRMPNTAYPSPSGGFISDLLKNTPEIVRQLGINPAVMQVEEETVAAPAPQPAQQVAPPIYQYRSYADMVPSLSLSELLQRGSANYINPFRRRS